MRRGVIWARNRMTEFLQRLKQRKLVQWAVAYLAAAWVALQVLDVAVDSYHWPDSVMHLAFGVLALGFVVTLVLAWYHGERGVQRVTGAELLLIALVLAVGGGLLWHFERGGSPMAATTAQSVKSTTGVAAHNVTSAASATVASASSSSTVPVSPTAVQPIPAKSIAVLPFENLSGDKGNAYFADGMQDLILTKLAGIGDLKVISRTSTAKYASHPDDLKAIAQQLGVATILEGSVQKAGNQVLINVQLIDANTDAHLWAEAYPRTLNNIFGVEGEVAQKVAEALQAKLTPAETQAIAKIPTRNAQAYDAFLQGEYYGSRGAESRLKSDFDLRIRNYREATELDPMFALAYARLALSQIWDLVEFGDDGSNLGAQAKVAMDRALALAPDLADAHLAQGAYRHYVLHDLDGALVSITAALALQPQNADAIFRMGVIYRHRGQWQAAFEAFQHASALNPKNAFFLNMVAFCAVSLRHYADAVRVSKQALALDPASANNVAALSDVYLLGGDLDRAMAVFDAAPATVRDNPRIAIWHAQVMLYRRDYTVARQLIAKVEPGNGVNAVDLQAVRGDIEWYAGNPTAARPHYSSMAALLEASIKTNPAEAADHFAHGKLGWVYARLGRTREALEQGQLGLTLHPADQDVPNATSALWQMAQIQAQVGQVAEAVASLDRMLAMPAGDFVSVPSLKLDPTWDPIRHDPRFQALLKKYGSAEPATAMSGGGHG